MTSGYQAPGQPTTMSTNATQMPATPSVIAFQHLSVLAVIFSSLSALFGAYVILFVLAIWSTYRRPGSPYRGLRIVTLVLFTLLLIHYVCRAAIFGQARMMNPPKNLFRTSTMPLTFVAATTSTLAGLISDGLLAWRFYVVFGRQRWAFWAPTVAILVNTLLGLSGDFELLGYYHNPQRYTTFFQLDTFKINAAWGWVTFSINTALSGGIIGRIIYISQNATRNSAARPYSSGYYATAVAAIIESALITWIGLLLYGIASLAPNGTITTAWNIGFVMVCIIPIFFGISQCLITARLGFANEQETRESKHAILGLPSSQNSKESAEEMAISVRKETVDDSESSVIGILGTIGEKV